MHCLESSRHLSLHKLSCSIHVYHFLSWFSAKKRLLLHYHSLAELRIVCPFLLPASETLLSKKAGLQMSAISLLPQGNARRNTGKLLFLLRKERPLQLRAFQYHSNRRIDLVTLFACPGRGKRKSRAGA